MLKIFIYFYFLLFFILFTGVVFQCRGKLGTFLKSISESYELIHG